MPSRPADDEDPRAMRGRSVQIDGHRTGFPMENIFWNELRAIARRQGTSRRALVLRLAAEPRPHSLASAVRVYVLQDALRRAEG